jgi:hypothetical protein
MMMKVYGGTRPQHADSLCDTCRHSRIVRGRRIDEELVFCDAAVMRSVRVTFKVTSCSEYTDNREPSYHELFHQAWILQPATKRRAAGFIHAADLKAEEVARLMAEVDSGED